jgi:hypothetical protein
MKIAITIWHCCSSYALRKGIDAHRFWVVPEKTGDKQDLKGHGRKKSMAF